jgi:hypothetical protein
MREIAFVDTDSLAEKGQRIYEEQLREKLEPKYKGKIAAVDVDTGEYFLGDSVIDAINKAKGKYPDKIFFIIRIGYKAVHVRR